MSEKPQPCRHKRPFCLECHGSEFQGGVSVKRTAIEYLKRNHPSACERAGLCETIGGRQYTVTLSCHGYVMASDYEALQAECEKLREHLQNLIDQTTPLEPVPGNPMWSRRIQLDEAIAERDSLRAECDALVEALEFYAKGEHCTPYDPDQWDTVSGEPLNLLHHDDGADGSAGFVENGSIAKAALASHRKQQEDKP